MGRDVLLLYMSPKNPNYKTQTNEDRKSVV